MTMQRMARAQKTPKSRGGEGKTGNRSRRRFLNRLGLRPNWAERYMRRADDSNMLAARCLDGRFWMCLRAGFDPLSDVQWDWWRGLRWHDQFWLYEQGMAIWRIERQLRKKKNPDSQFSPLRAADS